MKPNEDEGKKYSRRVRNQVRDGRFKFNACTLTSLTFWTILGALILFANIGIVPASALFWESVIFSLLVAVVAALLADR